MTKAGITLATIAMFLLTAAHAPEASAQTLATEDYATGTSTTSEETESIAQETGDDTLLMQDGDMAASEETMLAPEGRRNAAISSVDGAGSAMEDSDEAPGIRIGGFVFSPSLRQSLGHEDSESGASKSSRTYSETELKGSLTSDWSRHQLTVNGTGTFQKNIAGSGSESPEWNLDAELRLDVTRNTTVMLNGGYDYQRESATDPNSVSGASAQADVHTFNSGVSIEQTFGRLKGTLSATGSRSTYGSAKFANGTTLSQSDRDNLSGDLALRLGYQISPALMPFVEGSISRTAYDQTTDSSGYARNSAGWKMRAGVEAEFNDKLKGEVSGGYEHVDYSDSRLASISTTTIDGSLTWSPRRGTDITLSAGTSIKPSTVAGTSGYVSRNFTAALSQEITRRLVARLSASMTDSDYAASSSASDIHSLNANAGLTWRVNRYVDLTGDVDWQYDSYSNGGGYHATSFMAGLTLKR